MSRIAALLIEPDRKTPVGELLEACLFGTRTTSLQAGAAGQYDPGRAGGANRGPGVANESLTNPWELVLSLEGAVAWASGIYRRQGTSYRTILCSPFTVRPRAVGYGSADKTDDARAEIWTPLWTRPVRYAELQSLLREGRASVQGRAAENALEFAEAACGLGVDRGIERFVRYSLLKRRGDSYVALPIGNFATGYRSASDRARQIQQLLDRWAWELPKGVDDLRRGVDAAIYELLLRREQEAEHTRLLVAALGRLIRRTATTSETRIPTQNLPAEAWIKACDPQEPEVRIAAALASIYGAGVGSIVTNLARSGQRFAWTGANLAARLAAVLDRRLQVANTGDRNANAFAASLAIHPGDATLFIEGSVDDELIEDLLFGFLALDWRGFVSSNLALNRQAEVMPVYATIKALFLPSAVERSGESIRIRPDARVLSLLRAEDIEAAAALAVHRLRVAGLRPIEASYIGGVDSRRLAGALLIPVWPKAIIKAGILHPESNEVQDREEITQ